jgi:hypothetical protein
MNMIRRNIQYIRTVYQRTGLIPRFIPGRFTRTVQKLDMARRTRK